MRARTAGLLLAIASAPALGGAKEKVMLLSWGDVIWQHRGQGLASLDTPEKIRKSARVWKRQGTDKVLFRADDFRILLHHEILAATDDPYVQEWTATTRRAWESGLLAAAVEATKREGMQGQAWITIFGEGCPPEVLHADSSRFPWQSRFTRTNPHVLACDRSLTTSQRKVHGLVYLDRDIIGAEVTQ